MIKLEIQLALCYASSASDYSSGQISCAYISFNNLHMTKNAAERIHDVTRIKISRCDFVQHRRKQNEILATDQRHLYVRSTREPLVEVHCRVKPGKSATGNDYSPLLVHLAGFPFRSFLPYSIISDTIHSSALTDPTE